MQLPEELRDTSVFAAIVDNNSTSWYEFNFAFTKQFWSKDVAIILLIIIILFALWINQLILHLLNQHNYVRN